MEKRGNFYQTPITQFYRYIQKNYIHLLC